MPCCRNAPRPQLQPPIPVCPLKPLGLKTSWGVCLFSSKLSKIVSSGALSKCQCQVLARGENFIAIINLENMFFIKQVPAQPSVQLW